MTSGSDDRTYRVLIVDDDPILGRTLRRILEAEQYQVVVAVNCESAEAALNAGLVDVVISDVMMPRVRGPELVQRLRQIQPELPAVFMSGYEQQELEGIDWDDTPFLAKPFDLDRILDLVRDATEHP